MRSDKYVDTAPLNAIREVGAHLGADAVIAGHIYRWREREGTEYAVNRAASVAFDLNLIKSGDGALLWKAKYDKTQKSLFENALDISTFVQSRGRWIKVEKLARMGLDKLFAAMPEGRREAMEAEDDPYSGY